MRIALVSPYSWTYPGGVARHIEALAEHLLADGHHVRVLAPFDPPDRRSERLHRGARPQDRELADYVIPLGRTAGIPANGAVSNVALTPSGLQILRRELEAGQFDVVNVHEPVAPPVSWDALGFGGRGRSSAPSTPTARTPSRTGSPARWAPDAACVTCTAGSRSPRPRPGPRAASSVVATTSFPTASSCRRRRRSPRAGVAGRAAHRVRRPGGRAQGPAGAAARVRGSARAHRRGARDRRRGALGGRAAAAGRSRRRPCSAASTTLRRRASCARPTCCARRRSAARASGWS